MTFKGGCEVKGYKRDLDIIGKWAEDLIEAMGYGEEEFDDRLGRKKPGLEVMKIEGKMPMKMMAKEGMEDDDMDMKESMKEVEMGPEPYDFEEEEEDYDLADEDKDLKRRLKKLRRG
jgi:hypothetical protein